MSLEQKIPDSVIVIPRTHPLNRTVDDVCSTLKILELQENVKLKRIVPYTFFARIFDTADYGL